VKNHERDTAVALGQPCGPLSFHIPGFAASLASQGYTKTSIAYRFALVGHSTAGCNSVGYPWVTSTRNELSSSFTIDGADIASSRRIVPPYYLY